MAKEDKEQNEIDKSETDTIVANKKKKVQLGFILVMLQTLIIGKILILYFGQEVTQNPEPRQIIIFILVLLYCFGSPIVFAIRHYKDFEE